MPDRESIRTLECGDSLMSRPNTPQPTIEQFDVESNYVKPRPRWDNGVEFLMSCISLSVGLGNIWRFPYTCYENGGAVFLIPYLIILFFIGKPFYFLEMILGQFTSQGSMKAIQVVPLLKGVGWGQQVVSAVIATYYSSLVALTLSYLVRSFALELPWSECDPSDDTCYSSKDLIKIANKTSNTRSSADIFFSNTVLKEKSDISDGIGYPVDTLAICLLISWIFVYISMAKGIKTSGKVAYVFAILPYIILFLILIRALTLDGAWRGIKFFLFPKSGSWGKLFSLKIWLNATTQCFFSLTIGMGCIIMFSGYNKFDRNIYKDAIVVSLMDTFTSLLSGFTIFAILGNLSLKTGQDIREVVQDSVKLAFITYPDALSKIETSLHNAGFWPQIMAILFFSMLFTIGSGSVVGLLNNMATNFKDYFPKLKYWQLSLIAAVGGFSAGLIYVTPGGMAMLELVDHFGGQILVFVLAIIELLGVVWIYGIENICWDVEFMLKRKVSPFFKISWFIIMPLFLLTICSYWILQSETPTYGNGKVFPIEALSFGWTIFFVGLGQVVLAIGFVMFKNRNEWTYLIRPSPEWGPKDNKTRSEWAEFKLNKLKERDCIATAEGHSWMQKKVLFLLGKYP